MGLALHANDLERSQNRDDLLHSSSFPRDLIALRHFPRQLALEVEIK